MKKLVLVATIVLVAGATVIGVVKAVPFLRNVIAIARHTRYAAQRLPAAEAEWKSEFGDPLRTLSSFPSHEDTDAAIRLIDLARSVGVDLTRPTADRPGRHDGAVEQALSEALKEFGDRELTCSGGAVGPPPETVRAYLEAHDREIGLLVAALVRSEPLAWKTDLSLGHSAPLPNLLGLIRLQRVLVAEALLRANQGDDDKAEKALLASWILNGSLRDRPDLVSQLIAISVARMQVGLGRRLNVDPATWSQRYTEHDFRSGLLRAVEVDSILDLRQFPTGSLRARASRTDFLDARRALLTRLRDAFAAHAYDSAPTSRSDAEVNPKTAGGIVAFMGESNLITAVQRADRLAIDIELTEHILEVRLQHARLGHLPSEMPSFRASRMPGAHWKYSVNEGSHFSISFSGELHPDDRRGLILPLHYEGQLLPFGRRRTPV